ncbi:hypothetical protein Trydic_g2618 [Trypoxylus dichotomus]
MSQIPAIEFTQINTYANERDLKLWKQQAVAKYCKLKYEEFHKENETLDKKIEKCKHKIKRAEEEGPEIKALIERTADSINITSRAIDHLIRRKVDVANEIISIKDRYEKIIARYSIAYQDEKKALEQDNALYRELDETTISDSQHLLSVKKEIKEKRIIAQSLIKEYERIRLNKGRTESQNVTKQNELPKLSIQAKPRPGNLNIPTFPWSVPIQANQNVKSKINEVNLLSELKQRSNERQKIIRQRQTSLLTPQKKLLQQAPSSGINSTCNNTTTNDNRKANVTPGNFEKEQSVVPPPKVIILQNEVINNHENPKSKVQVPEKRQASEELHTDVKTKKTKKVSFGEYLSQEDRAPHPVVNNLESRKRETSSYFTKTSNINESLQFENSFLNRSDGYTQTADFSIQGNTSDVMRDLMNSKDLTNDDMVFSLSNYKNVENDQDQPFWGQSSQPSHHGLTRILSIPKVL